MKQIFNISFLTLILLGYTLKDALIYVSFEMNREVIAEKWCENKDRPQLHCDGQCVFMKAIKAGRENRSGQEPAIPVETFKGKITSFICAKPMDVHLGEVQIHQTSNGHYLMPYYSADRKPLLKPPQA